MSVAEWVAGPAIAALAMTGLGTYRFVARRKRLAGVNAFVAQHGMSYVKRDDRWAHLDHWGRPWGVGKRRRAYDVVTGTFRGKPVLCFMYHYTTTSPGSGPDDGNTTQHHYYSVYTMALPRSLPGLYVTRRLTFGRSVLGIGVRPSFADSPVFAEAYDVRCAVPQFAADVLTSDLQNWLLGRHAPGFIVVDDRIFVTFPGRLTAEGLAQWLEHLSGVVDHFPPALTAR